MQITNIMLMDKIRVFGFITNTPAECRCHLVGYTKKLECDMDIGTRSDRRKKNSQHKNS